MIVGASRRARLVAGGLSGGLTTVVVACTPSTPAPPPAPARPTVVGQPAPAEQRDLTPFIKFPCNLVPPAVVAEFVLGEIRATVPGPESPEEPAGCKAAVAKGPPGSGGTENDATVVPFDRDIVGEEEASSVRLDATPPVAGLPAGVRPGWGTDECAVFVRAAPAQGLRVELVRYRDKPDAESPCDLARHVAGSALAWVPR